MLKITTMTTLIFLFAALSGWCEGGGGGGFYQRKCKGADVEAVVGGVINASYNKDPTTVIALLHMQSQSHDCFVNGCDASFLLDGNGSEKIANPNLSVRGYEIIDAAKAAVEAICPGVVSRSDVIVMATRNAVALGRGGRYGIQIGKRDGTLALATENSMVTLRYHVTNNLVEGGSKPEMLPTFYERQLRCKSLCRSSARKIWILREFFYRKCSNQCIHANAMESARDN